MSQLISTLVRKIEVGNEDAETLFATLYVNSELQAKGLLPLDGEKRKFYIKNLCELVFPDKAYGLAITEKVIYRFITEVKDKGPYPPYVRHLFSKSAEVVKKEGYHGKCRFYDEYFLLWNLGYLYFKQKKYEQAAFLLTHAQNFEVQLCGSVPEIGNCSQSIAHDACILTTQEISIAQYNYGLYLEEKGRSDSRYYSNAVKYYEAAVKAGNDSAMTALAMMYHEGRGVTKDDAKALSLLKKAADSNSRAKEYLKVNFPKEVSGGGPTINIGIGDNSILWNSPITGLTVDQKSDLGNMELSDSPTNSPFLGPRYAVINDELVELSPEDCQKSGSKTKIPNILF